MKRKINKRKDKGQKIQAISVEDKELMIGIYNIRAQFAQGVYLTPILNDKSTVVRYTFVEKNQAVNKDHATHAVLMTIEDTQAFYNAMGAILQHMRELGRIA